MLIVFNGDYPVHHVVISDHRHCTTDIAFVRSVCASFSYIGGLARVPSRVTSKNTILCFTSVLKNFSILRN